MIGYIQILNYFQYHDTLKYLDSSGMFSVRIPAATDLSRKNRALKTALLLNALSRCGTLKKLHCSMTMSAEHRSKFAALYW